MNSIDRCRLFIAKLPKAIITQGGSRVTYQAACLTVEFGLTWAEAWGVLAEWNTTHCDPLWTERELRHKLTDAFERTVPKAEFVNDVHHSRSGSATCSNVFRADTSGIRLAPQVARPTCSKPASSQLAKLLLSLPAGNRWQLEKLAELRGLSPAAVALASERRLLRFGLHQGQKAWFITDQSHRVASARRMDGQPWPHGKRPTMLAGSQGAWPVGIYEAAGFHHIALCEGGPDLLAAFHFIDYERRHRDCAPVAVLSASMKIPGEALAHFRDKRVRIFSHADCDGDGAFERWKFQLSTVGAVVDRFNFADVFERVGECGKDLNDLARIYPDAGQTNELLPRVLP